MSDVLGEGRGREPAQETEQEAGRADDLGSDGNRLNYEFELGQVVRHSMYCKAVHDDWAGCVTAREQYENQAGASNWYYVRWIEPSGCAMPEVVRIGEMELERFVDGE